MSSKRSAVLPQIPAFASKDKLAIVNPQRRICCAAPPTGRTIFGHIRGDHSKALAAAALYQELIQQAHLTFIWSAVVERGKWKYRQRAYRYIYLDAGHIAQNLYLAAEALGLGVCAIGAFFDHDMNSLMGFDGTRETVIYMASVGFKAR